MTLVSFWDQQESEIQERMRRDRRRLRRERREEISMDAKCPYCKNYIEDVDDTEGCECGQIPASPQHRHDSPFSEVGPHGEDLS